MVSCLETECQTATQNPLTYHKTPALQLKLNTEVLVQKKQFYINKPYYTYRGFTPPDLQALHHFLKTFLKL